MARPSTYSDKVLKDAKSYISKCPDTIPTVVGLCHCIKRSKSTVYSWAKDDDKAEFLDILEQIEEMQEKTLVQGGILGEFNATITKMMLTKHGYSDKQEIEHSGAIDLTHYTDEELQRICDED